MRNFFKHQSDARRNTGWLVLYFLCAVALLVGFTSVCLYVLTTFSTARLYQSPTPFNLSPSLWDYSLLSKIGSVILILILAGTIYKYLRLRSGGGALIAQLLGGRPLYPDTNDFYERRLLNIIEEMAIASGVTVPTVYILERESGINAFAAGFSQEDAVIGVTKGAILYLERDELQGVIAHEFSHIVHGDMLINIRLQGLLHGILVIGLLGEMLIRTSFGSDDSSSRSGGSGSVYLVVIGLILLIMGYSGLFIAKLIKSAVARQREFLADASAVQFTRNPAGLAGALKKIGGFSAGSKMRSPHAREISHMFFENGFEESWFNGLATHPPLLVRIQRLEPGFSGTFARQLKPVGINEEEAIQYLGRPGGVPGSVSPSAPPPKERHAFIASLAGGRDLKEVLSGPGIEHLRMAREIIDSLPVVLQREARNPFGARAVVYGLLLDTDQALRARQLALLAEKADSQVFAELNKIRDDIDSLPAESRLPLLDLSIPALKTLSAAQYGAFRKNIKLLMQADSAVSLFEYTLHRVLFKNLHGHFAGSAKKGASITSLAPVRDEISCLLTMLALHGSSEQADARKSFMKSSRTFGRQMKYFSFLPAHLCTLAHFDRALKQLALAAFPIKEQLLAACLECIVSDGRVTIDEAQLFRAIAESLDCPVPLWLKPA